MPLGTAVLTGGERAENAGSAESKGAQQTQLWNWAEWQLLSDKKSLEFLVWCFKVPEAAAV